MIFMVIKMDDQLKILEDRLNFLLYYASHKDYDQSEVDLLIKRIDELKPEESKTIENSIETFSITDLRNKVIVEKSKVGTNVVKIIVSFIAASILFAALGFNKEMIAGRKTGIFNLFNKDNTGFSFITSIEPDVINIDDLDSVPIEAQEIIEWKPSVVNNLYRFDYANLKKDNNIILEINQYYKNGNDSLELKYNFMKDSFLEMDLNLTESVEIGDLSFEIYVDKNENYYTKIQNSNYKLIITSNKLDAIISLLNEAFANT